MPTTLDLWTVVQGRPAVDPEELAEAIVQQVAAGDLDFRSRLLIRDSLNALEQCWGDARLNAWLVQCPVREELKAIRREDLGQTGFPSLGRRVMEPTRPETIRQFLRELGGQVHKPLMLLVGGSAALILPGLLLRKTDDVDVVNEVPAELRAQPDVMDRLAERYSLHVRHFQSHYLPDGWENRLHSLGAHGLLNVFLVDPYDILLSKLNSAREKDRDDLRVLAPQLDKDILTCRLHDTMTRLLAEDQLRRNAEQNWYIIFGEALPS